MSARPFARTVLNSVNDRPRSRFRGAWHIVAARLLVTGAILSALSVPARAAGLTPTSPEVRVAIDRAVTYLRTRVDDIKIQEVGIVGYAMIRGGEPIDSPAIRKLERRLLTDKFDKTSYGKGTQHQFYEAGIDMMFLEAVNPTRYRPEISLIATFTVDHQWPSGSWYYFGTSEHGGDTSHTQYAVLGLWAAARSGVRIPMSVWSRVADWHLKTQCEDGGFAYHPADGRFSTHTMTVNGVASLCVARMMLYPNRDYPSPFAQVPEDEKDEPAQQQDPPHAAGRAKPKPPPKKDPAAKDNPEDAEPVLRPINLGGEGPAGSSRQGRKVTTLVAAKIVPLSRLNRGIYRGANWVRNNFTKKVSRYQLYYLYGLERMCALANIEDFDGHDWYSSHAAVLLRRQLNEGNFEDAFEIGPYVDTSFAILFLSRATRRLIHHEVNDPRVGGGLMIGGRGLPKNLAAVQTSGDGIKVRKLEAPVDKLLSELENPKSNQVEVVQQAIIETVQVGDREKLIGQKDRLKRLVHDPRAEVRRTALWALGRCATVRDALFIVKALDDSDINVVIEANNALCWLSRRPNGFGRPLDPLANLPENATEDQRHQAMQIWRAQVRKDWRDWFAQVAPYSERELPIDLPGTNP